MGKNGQSFFPAEETRGLSLLEAVAYASSEELVELEAKLDRLVTRASRLKPNRPTRRRLARLILGSRMAVKCRLDKRRQCQVWGEWLCFEHRSGKHSCNLVALIVEVGGRSVLGIARSKELSKLPDKTLQEAWKNELAILYEMDAGARLHAWARRVHNDRIAATTGKLRAWAELMLFKWKPTTEAAHPVPVA